MHKRDVVKSLMDRASKISTKRLDQIKRKQRVISTLQSNGYPKHFFLSANKPKPRLKDITTVAKSEGGYSKIPYVSGTSEPIREFWKTTASKVAFKPYQAIS